MQTIDPTLDVRPILAKPPEGQASVSPFLNRELSWLEFNRRVLHEALDERTPLLERVRFLGIFNSNLDEYYMKRVGGLKRQVAAGVQIRSADGLTQAEQLSAIRRTVLEMLKHQADAFQREIIPGLKAQGIHLLSWEELTPRERTFATRYFTSQLFPVLTPLAVDPGHPFPFISNLSTSLAVMLRRPDREENLFARIKVPEIFPQWVRVDEGKDGCRFVRLQDIIQQNLERLFPKMEIRHVMPFRVTRNADLALDEEDAEDLLAMMEEEVRQRRFARPIRLELGPNPQPWIQRFLMDQLELTEEDVYVMHGELDYVGLAPVADLNLPELHFPAWSPAPPPSLADEEADLFAVIRRGDLLVHHPYESFNASVERFILSAAVDPEVLAIKMAVYRTGADSPFVKALIRAAQAGKQVVCLVELKARFDEERNIFWAQELEKAGVHVVYGIVGLKAHGKTALVVRRDPDGLRCYAHIGTGNYNTQTARLYTDLGLFTCRPEITDELVEVFNYLTGHSSQIDYHRLLVAPVNMRDRFLEMIERETQNARDGKPARIVAKMNSLEERSLCRALYAASQAGVQVDLIVRGFCCLRPGVPGLSERIRVISCVGRFLEHSRIFYFQRGAADPLGGEFYIGSADWMYRNLLARVEVVAPVDAPALRERLWEILQLLLTDTRQVWDMQPDGSYLQRRPSSEGNGAESQGVHLQLMKLARQRSSAGPREDRILRAVTPEKGTPLPFRALRHPRPS